MRGGHWLLRSWHTVALAIVMAIIVMVVVMLLPGRMGWMAKDNEWGLCVCVLMTTLGWSRRELPGGILKTDL